MAFPAGCFSFAFGHHQGQQSVPALPARRFRAPWLPLLAVSLACQMTSQLTQSEVRRRWLCRRRLWQRWQRLRPHLDDRAPAAAGGGDLFMEVRTKPPPPTTANPGKRSPHDIFFGLVPSFKMSSFLRPAYCRVSAWPCCPAKHGSKAVTRTGTS